MMSSSQFLLVLLTLITAAAAGAVHNPNDVHRLITAKTELSSSTNIRLVGHPTALKTFTTFTKQISQFSSGSTQQLLEEEETTIIQVNIEESSEEEPSLSANGFIKLFGAYHEPSSLHVLIALIFIVTMIVAIFSYICCCRKRSSPHTSCRRTPKYMDTLIQRSEDLNYMHRNESSEILRENEVA